MNDRFLLKDNRQLYSLEHGKELSQFLKAATLSMEDDYNANMLLIKELHKELKEKELQLGRLEMEMKDTSVLFSANNKLKKDIDEIRKIIEDIKSEINMISASNEVKIMEINKYKECYQYFDLFLNESDNNVYSYQADRKHSFIGLKVLETQEDERQRIARELHDSTVQNLTSIIHKTELCIKLLDIDIIRAKLELATMTHTIKIIINEMREIIYDLKPMSLSDLGLVVTVRQLAKQIMVNNDIKTTVRSNEERDDILPVIRLTLFRVIQEACNNIIKHAKANSIEIDFNFEDSEITVVIKDNGIGFDCNILDQKFDGKYGFGIPIMKERIYLLSGSLNIDSKINGGTIITVKVPTKIYGWDTNEESN